MADADLARKIGDQLGKVPDASLALCLGLVLRRPDFGPDAARVEVVRAIGKIPDHAAVNALDRLHRRDAEEPAAPVAREAEKIVEARLGRWQVKRARVVIARSRRCSPRAAAKRCSA